MLLNRELKYNEFKGFWECITGNNLSNEDYRSRILEKYTSSNDGLTEKGFINFFEDNIVVTGGEVITSYF